MLTQILDNDEWNMFAVNLTCLGCGATYSPNESVVVCEKCGDVLDVRYDMTKIQRSIKKASLKNRVHSLWRYRELLPITNDSCIVSLGEGMTPTVQVSRYGALLKNLRKLSLKLDYLNPTGAFKDRGSTVSVSKLREMNITAVMEDSSGNAGASLAAYCAAAGIECTLYVPSGAPSEKLLQAKLYGAKIRTIAGSRTDVAKAAENAWRTTGLYYASHNLSAFFLEGMKTFAYELAEDMSWEVPEHVVFPVGGGALLAGAWKGFEELLQLGWVKRLPRFHCVQSEACMPIVEAHRRGAMQVGPAQEGETIAGGIRIANPPRGRQVLEILYRSSGQAVAVSDQAILQHQKALARNEGIFAEPTSCAALAGLEKLFDTGAIAADESVVVAITGFGLKDSKNAANSIS
jgi:threonine synthase